MKYRTKLYLFLIGISCSALILGLSLIVYTSHKALFKDIANQAVSISATAATNMNGDLVAQIRTPEDQSSPAYKEIRTYLRKVRDVNRNANIYVKYIYTMFPDPNNPEKFFFGVDPEENTEDFSPPGSDNPGASEDLLSHHLSEDFSSGKLTTDKWGTWLTGYAPIRNQDGEYVATLGVDISAQFVSSVMYRLYKHAAIALSVGLLFSFVGAAVLSSRLASALSKIHQAAREFGSGNLNYRLDIKTHDEFQDLAESANKMAESLQEKERMKVGFAHYVSAHVLEQITKTGAPQRGGERKKITVFFCDIRDFTKISEQLPPEEVMAILNDYFTAMLEIVFKHNGMLDKLIGDAIMAEFGYPVEDPEQERNAVLTGLEMQSALSILRAKWRKKGRPDIHIGVGIHTGEAVVGIIGSKDRVEFTAIGDTVNTASRLEQATKEFKEEIIISETTYQAIKDEFKAKPLGLIQMKGKEKPMNAYAILPLK